MKNEHAILPLLSILFIIAWAAVSYCIFLFLTPPLAVTAKNPEDNKLVLYDGPTTMKSSDALKAYVNGYELFVYDTAVNNTHTWEPAGLPPLSTTPITYFDFEGTADITLEMNTPEEINHVSITPSSHGITHTLSEGKLQFQIQEPGFYTIQFNNLPADAVHIFANPLETDVPNPDDENVIYIGPGEWAMETINIESGQTLYIAGGAVVHSIIQANSVEDVTVRGRGIITGSSYDGWMLKGATAMVPIDFRNSKNIEVEGLIFLNPNAWTFNSFESENAHISNIKIISARPNGDGITLQSCKDFFVTNSFVRTWDDSLVVKNYGGNTDNITFDNIVVWTDLAQSMEIGYETNKGGMPDAIISNVTFQNITVINNYHKPVISIHNSDDALVTDIIFRDIVVENAQMGGGDAGDNNQLIDFTIASSGWASTRERGRIENVLVENVNVLSGKFPPSRIAGFDETHQVKNVTIRNLTILGEKINSLEDGKVKTNLFVDNIVLEGGQE